MKPVEFKVARVGNSRGVRIPAATLERYRVGDSVVVEERSDGILLRALGPAAPKLSWEETAREMAAEAEDWRDTVVERERNADQHLSPDRGLDLGERDAELDDAAGRGAASLRALLHFTRAANCTGSSRQVWSSAPWRPKSRGSSRKRKSR